MKLHIVPSICVIYFILINSRQTESFALLTAWTSLQYLFTLHNNFNVIKGYATVDKSSEYIKESLADIMKGQKRIEKLVTKETNRVISELTTKIDLEIVKKFTVTVNFINNRYNKKFPKYSNGTDGYNSFTIGSFINETIGEETSFKKSLDQIRELIVQTDIFSVVNDQRLFQVLLDHYKLKVRLLNKQ